MLQSSQSQPQPVGVRILSSTSTLAHIPVYRGVSYCDAVRRAGEGEPLRILPGCIEVCRWAPAVLGLKAPRSRFEQGLTPRLPDPVAGILLAPLDRFAGEPQVVLVRSKLERLRPALAAAGPDRLWDSRGREPNQSALSLLGSAPATWKHRLVGLINHSLAALARLQSWQTMTRWVFRSAAATEAYDALISRTQADMSICRNSTVIPLLTGRINVSFFCSGGITWGLNDPDSVTSGWPWLEYQRLLRNSQE